MHLSSTSSSSFVNNYLISFAHSTDRHSHHQIAFALYFILHIIVFLLFSFIDVGADEPYYPRPNPCFFLVHSSCPLDTTFRIIRIKAHWYLFSHKFCSLAVLLLEYFRVKYRTLERWPQNDIVPHAFWLIDSVAFEFCYIPHQMGPHVKILLLSAFESNENFWELQ